MGIHRSEQWRVADGSFISVDFYSCCEHDGEIRQRVLNLKYRGQKTIARELAHHLVGEVGHIAALDVLTWAPTSPMRRLERGFDHGELLVRHVGVATQVPCRRLLRRVNNDHQTGKTREVRLQQPCFVSRPLGRYRTICVVDDVMTTGATLRAAAKALAEMGARHIVCMSVTYVPDQ